MVDLHLQGLDLSREAIQLLELLFVLFFLGLELVRGVLFLLADKLELLHLLLHHVIQLMHVLGILDVVLLPLQVDLRKLLHLLLVLAFV